MIEDLYHAFLTAGHSPLLFWDLSIAEVNDMLRAYSRAKTNELKQLITVNTTLAQQIYERIGSLLSNEETSEFTPVWKLFPGLFEEEKKISEKRKRELELANYKARFIHFAMRYNERSGGE